MQLVWVLYASPIVLRKLCLESTWIVVLRAGVARVLFPNVRHILEDQNINIYGFAFRNSSTGRSIYHY